MTAEVVMGREGLNLEVKATHMTCLIIYGAGGGGVGLRGGVEGGIDRIKQLKQRFLSLDVRVRLGVSWSVSD